MVDLLLGAKASTKLATIDTQSSCLHIAAKNNSVRGAGRGRQWGGWGLEVLVLSWDVASSCGSWRVPLAMCFERFSVESCLGMTRMSRR